jgi:hypothetical protein
MMSPDTVEADHPASEETFSSPHDASAEAPPQSPPRHRFRSLFQIVCLQGSTPTGTKTPT